MPIDASSPRQLVKAFIPPMLATLVTEVPGDDAGWLYELKYDGFRAISAVTGGEAAMLSRNGLDLADRFPRVHDALAKIKGPGAVLDGEIVVLDENGVPRFQLLQRGGDRAQLFVFDLLWLDGVDLRAHPIEHRRELLEKLLRRAPKGIRIAERFDVSGALALARASREGWEGVIAKRRRSIYEPRRSKEWLKIKAVNMQELAVIGFTPSTHSDMEIGALLLGVMDGGVMHYAGRVGTGFSAKQRTELKRELQKDALRDRTAFDAPRMRDATWVKPKLVAQVRFTEWTSDGKLRHPSFLGFRIDKKPSECVREKPEAVVATKVSRKVKGTNPEAAKKTSSKKPTAGKAPAKPTVAPKKIESGSTGLVVLTSPDRLLYPRDGITKKDVAEYYAAMSEPMINALRGRPLALEHWNQGIDKPSWFHQNIGDDAPDWLTVVETPTRTSRRTVSHVVVDRPETLQFLAQRSALTIHMWSSRDGSLERPDWVVFDLDPAKGKGIEQAVEAALVLRGLFENLELPSVPKTSGKRGIHLFVPLQPRYSHEEAAEFASRLAEAVAKKLSFTTTERPIQARRGRLYLDALQNGYGKTVVAPYSLRAIDGAPVSAPLKWSEVTKKLDPKKYNLRTMPERLAKQGDLFAEVFGNRARLPRLK